MEEERLATQAFLARAAEQAMRYEDMVQFLTEVIKLRGAEVNLEERNLISVAFKALIQPKRLARRSIMGIAENPEFVHFSKPLAAYKECIESLLLQDCMLVIDTVNEHALSGQECGAESKAFFTKIIGDFYRYILEFVKDDRFEELKSKALAAYNEAHEIELHPCNPIKLGLALNFSVFHYEMTKDYVRAIGLAEEALEKALDEIDGLNSDQLYDAKSIIDLMQSNLSAWKEQLVLV